MRLAEPPPDIAEEADRLLDEWSTSDTTVSFEEFLKCRASLAVLEYMVELDWICKQVKIEEEQLIFDELCAKMKYNPLKDPYPDTLANQKDDSPSSLFSILSLEEMQFMSSYLIAHRDEIILP